MNQSWRSLLRVSRFFPFVALLAMILLFFNKMAFSNLILARGDTFLYFYPYWEAAANALRSGRVPLWNPNLFMGAPFLANSQVGFFYPLNWLVWLTLPTPYAVSASILLHLTIAGWGAYLAGRRALSLSREAAWLTAVLFALGGYLTAQVEHVNQLQGLAWLPWFLAALGRLETTRLETRDWRLILRRGTAVALLFSLQLLAGHTQTAFITGVGVAFYLATRPTHDASRHEVSRIAFRVLPLALGVALALLMTAVQLLPTLELAQHSSRQGGLALNEALSFSLHPLLVGRSLLPAYGQSLFTEYVAYLPLTALVLAIVGGWQWRNRPAVRPFVLMIVLAFLLALGRFTPIYWLLARLPGFDLFRVPARWLALYALGMALLAGVGWDVIRADWRLETGNWRLGRPFRRAIWLILLLIGWSWLSAPLARFIPLGPEAPAEYPAWQTVLGWSAELVILALLLKFRPQIALRRTALSPCPLVALSPCHLVILPFLYLATRALPYNHLTTPEAYFDWRPPIARLKVDTAVPPGRLLSLSDIFFDPGDQGEIGAIYAGQLPEKTLYDYVIAIKQKEIVAPNLSLAYGLSSVDGFDGGILPLSSYSQLTQLILPNQISATDGRLREHLTAVPQSQWLDLFNAQYLITDKTGDLWRAISPEQDAFFDLQHPVTLAPGESVTVGYMPPFPATGLALIVDGEVGVAQITVDNDVLELTPRIIGSDLYLVTWPAQGAVQALTLAAPQSGEWRIAGLTLINEDEHTFQSLVPGQYRLIHSGDVKIYENLDVLPRAFLVNNWQWRQDVAGSVAAMRAPGFDPGETAVLIGNGEDRKQPDTGVKATIIQYAPEQVMIQVESEAPAGLVLTDAYFPGWEATLDGQASPIYQADGLFRAIIIPAGQHTVVFSFKSRSFENGRLVSFVGLAVWILITVVNVNRIGYKRNRI